MVAPRPQKGEYASARKVVHGDYRDVARDEGVIVGVPRDKQGYYDILKPHDSKPFQGHIDDTHVVPDELLSQDQKDFKDTVKKMLKEDVRV
jgi:hypothetical protein